jgi:hypothetical protein
VGDGRSTAGAEMKIRTYSETLSDGSDVVNVCLIDDDGANIVLLACSPDDATLLVSKLYDAIMTHTVTSVELV